MKSLIKNKKLVVSLNTSVNTTELVIKKNNPTSHHGITRLGDVLNALPNGIIHKEETGMGATTLEIETPRNSIIVEPIKITASSKAHKHSVSDDKRILYVGSETRYHGKRIQKKDINQYLHNKSVVYKKIIVVADSLHKVTDMMTPEMESEYFFMIDEVDSFQMDSTYRRSMDDCIEKYKQWFEDKRCMVSATMINFSDPFFENEPFTKIGYDDKPKRNIHLMYSNTLIIKGVVFDVINKIVINQANEKILVAYNSVSSIYAIAEELKKQNIIDVKEISILCSRASKDKVGEYYRELDSDTLPTRVNFITSAYFTGFDLHEDFHLITVSGNQNIAHVLSDKKMKQIAGRCRSKLLSETIIHDQIEDPKKFIQITKELLLEIANIEIETLKCLKRHFKKNKYLRELHDKVSETIINTLDDNNSRYIKQNKEKDEISISYLNIDATVENNTTQHELYLNSNALYKLLVSQGHIVKRSIAKTKTIIKSVSLEEKDKVKLIEEIIDLLRTHKLEIVEIIIKQKVKLSGIQSKIFNLYKDYYQYVDKDQLLQLLHDKALSKDSREINNFSASLNYITSAPGSLFRSRLEKYFPINIRLLPIDIQKRWNLLLTETQINKDIDTPTKGVRLLKCFYKTIRKKDKTHLIVNNNPFNLKVLKTKKELEDYKTLEDLVVSVRIPADGIYTSVDIVDLGLDSLDLDDLEFLTI